MNKECFALIIVVFFMAFGSLALAQNTAWKGKITYSYSEEIKQYEPISKSDRSVLKFARQAFVRPSGEVYFLDMRFPANGKILRKSNSTYTQFNNVIDLTSNNPLFKERLDNYSVIKGTGNSGVISSMHHPQVSPNGKYVALTIFGYDKQIYDKNCIVIFDLSTGSEIARFDEKYGANWTKDNGLIIAGSYKSASSDKQEYHSKQPGIFFCSPDFKTIKRIDPDLNDPAPYHPALSPDGQKIAFILNNHVWTMNIDGSNLKQITDVDNDNIETFPIWSPDGKFIACWSYKTFERSYFTAIAILPADTPKPIVLSNNAGVWPRDIKNYRISGGAMQMCWN